MSMIVIYAEKPDMASTIARAIDPKSKYKDGYIESFFNGNQYCVTWGYGHMCRLQNFYEYDISLKTWSVEKFPYFPNPFKLKIIDNAGVKKQYRIIKDLFDKSEYIINATDADQEGELIFAYLYEYMNCKKKWKRLWLHSTETPDIIKQMSNLLEAKDVFNLLQAAKARSRSDQLIGFNGSALYSLKCGTLSTLGRVQTPTLNFVVEREKQIQNHIKSKYWTVQGQFKCNNQEYTGIFKSPEKFEIKSEADKIYNQTKGKDGIISDIKEKIETKSPPLLYDLASLQKDANSSFGFSAKKTLNIAQALYEKHYTTYPRTAWKGLPISMKKTALERLHALKERYPEWVDKAESIGKDVCCGQAFL